MRPIDKVLETIRAHPEGLTTVQIGQILYPNVKDYTSNTVCYRIYTKASNLAKYGLVSLAHEYRPNSVGNVVKTAVWRPVDD